MTTCNARVWRKAARLYAFFFLNQDMKPIKKYISTNTNALSEKEVTFISNFGNMLQETI